MEVDAVPVRFAVIIPAEKFPDPSLNTIDDAVLLAVADEYIVYPVLSSAFAAVAVIPEPDIVIVEAYWPVVSVPKATELAAIVALNVVSPEPDQITLPFKSPDKFKVLGVVQTLADPAVIP